MKKRNPKVERILESAAKHSMLTKIVDMLANLLNPEADLNATEVKQVMLGVRRQLKEGKGLALCKFLRLAFAKSECAGQCRTRLVCGHIKKACGVCLAADLRNMSGMSTSHLGDILKEAIFWLSDKENQGQLMTIVRTAAEKMEDPWPTQPVMGCIPMDPSPERDLLKTAIENAYAEGQIKPIGARLVLKVFRSATGAKSNREDKTEEIEATKAEIRLLYANRGTDVGSTLTQRDTLFTLLSQMMGAKEAREWFEEEFGDMIPQPSG